MVQQTAEFFPCDLGPVDYPQKIPSTDEFLTCKFNFSKEFLILLVDQIDITRNAFNLLVVVFLSLIHCDLWKTIATSINYETAFLEFIIQGIHHHEFIIQLSLHKFQILYEQKPIVSSGHGPKRRTKGLSIQEKQLEDQYLLL